MTLGAAPRVLLIAQWPTIKNAEYELIERIRHTGFKITVVDFLGFDVQSGACINDATLGDHYDFALSFHYETPKFLDVPTFLWVANPLEFMHAQGNYRTHLIHNLRSYDDYLFNGSDSLKEHIKSVVGSDWVDSGLGFFQSCSRSALLEPRAPGAGGDTSQKIFYCGVNWEAISDKESRAHGLLEILQERQIADFFGPTAVLGVNVWGGFPTYRGEIPFDGKSIFPAMHGYAAVLAVSSPAHLKSRTSSGRAIEGFAAGVPVISDDNHHVRSQFGDLVYYYDGATEDAKADSIQAALDAIRTRPGDAIQRVREAQTLISRELCFEVCLGRALSVVEQRKKHPVISLPASAASHDPGVVVDVFLFHHDPYAPGERAAATFANVPHVLRAMSSLAPQDGVRFRLMHAGPIPGLGDAQFSGSSRVEFIDVSGDAFGTADGVRLLLGEKVSRLARLATGDFAVFLTQSDFPQHDYFVKALESFSRRAGARGPALHVAGFFVNDFAAAAPMSAAGILRNSSSTGLYRWTQSSIAEHQLGQLCFNRDALAALSLERLRRFDVLLPIAAILDCMSRAVAIHRSRHLLLRARHGYYHRYYDAFSRVTGKGLWAQHYELLSNATHEINRLYDAFHEYSPAVAIADKILGIDLPPPPPPPAAVEAAPVDPALLQQVADLLNTTRPYVSAVKRIGRAFGLGK